MYNARLAEERKMNNSDFRLFQVCHFKIVTTRCYYYVLQTGVGSISCSMYVHKCTLRCKHLFCGNDINRVNANTLIGDLYI